MRMRIPYKTYPLSRALTQKSMRVATLTHPLYAMCLGCLPGGACFVLTQVPAFLLLSLAGAVMALVLAPRIRRKQNARLEAAYARIVADAKNGQSAS